MRSIDIDFPVQGIDNSNLKYARNINPCEALALTLLIGEGVLFGLVLGTGSSSVVSTDTLHPRRSMSVVGTTG